MAEQTVLPLISVLVPIYNMASYLHKCLFSIVNQTYKNLEIICINDGSTDDSLEIIKEFAGLDQRIKIINKANSGYGNSMNCGLEAATGDYIGIVESDDFIAPGMYAELVNLSQNGTVDIIKCNFYDYFLDAPRQAVAIVNRERKHIESSKKPFTFRDNPDFSFGHPSVWSAIYKRSLIEDNKIRFREVKGGGWVDNPFFYETLVNAKSIMWTQKPLYYYLKTNPSSSSNFQTNARLPFERMHENLDVLERYNYRDGATLKASYARALQYMTGVYKDFDCNQDPKTICDLSENLMKRLDRRIIFNNFNFHDKQIYLSALSPFTKIQALNPRILIYNWIPFDNSNNWGGGVNIYCRNLIKALRRIYPNINIYFLSSGYAYDGEKIPPFIRKIDNIFFKKECFWGNVQQYEIVNSPIPAPIDKLLVNPSHAIANETLKDVFADFIERHGPFSAIHFNNIEGISLDVLELKDRFPESRFIFSLHNYVPFCPHGFYYRRHEHKTCSPDHTGADCMACTRMKLKTNIASKLYKECALYNKDPEACLEEEEWIKALNLGGLDRDTDEDHILDYCSTAIDKINRNCDVILAVSERVKSLAIRNGMAKEKLRLSYIGTEVADGQRGEAATKMDKGILRLVYLGSSVTMEEKGYPFLLAALANMNKRQAAHIELVLTMQPPVPKNIKSMLAHFRNVKIIEGYSHKDLPSILAGCHLSIVPVLWEDNLPQIAIESVAYGVPVLASSAGGASELCASPLFRFEAGNSADLLSKIGHFLQNPQDLAEYWNHHDGLTTMSQHVAEMFTIYNLPDNQGISFSAEEWRELSAELMFYREKF